MGHQNLVTNRNNVNGNEASIMEGRRLSFFTNKMFNIGYGPPPNMTPHQQHHPMYREVKRPFRSKRNTQQKHTTNEGHT